jgi:hypothetical protein
MVLRFLTKGFSSLLNIGKFIKWPQNLSVAAAEFSFLKTFFAKHAADRRSAF